MSSLPSEVFPVSDLIPKKETTSSTFLQKYPTYDGRGAIIGIFDSGIDPGAPGLQVTSDGKPKIIHSINATGAGDVDTSTVVTAENGTIKGLTGRTLKIPTSWVNPSGKFHIGIKHAYTLFPQCIVSRTKREYKEKHFDPNHKLAKAEALRNLNSVQDKSKDSKDTLTCSEKLTQADAQAAVDVLSLFEKESDHGPSYDCILFHDGSSWQAAIDTTEGGDLSQVTLLPPFSESHKYATFEDSKLNYTINVYDDGNLLEIVVPATDHGTHVASIAASNFPDDPDRNGVAPGAQIVNICIGSNLLNSMETTTGLTRAALRAVELGVDVINMSYGEYVHWIGSPILNILSDLTKKHGIVFCASAGNNGTLLSTVNAPVTTEDNCIMGIGSYLSGAMMLAEYSVFKSYSGTPHTYTSRGPMLNGAIGVSVSAPGAAIASLPNYFHAGSGLRNGTSMASPNCAGCVALLVSGLKQENISYSPFSIRRSVEKTAYKPPEYDVFSMGSGLVQVDKAFEHLKQYQNRIDQDIRFDIKINSVSNGIYVRVAQQDAKVEIFNTTVTPYFLNDKEKDASEKIKFNQELLLVCDDSWVQGPKYLSLPYSARVFPIKVDPTSLSVGVHYSSIRAYDSNSIESGVVFEIPITYVIAETLETSKNQMQDEKSTLIYRSVPLKSAQTKRIFIDPPLGSSHVQVQVTNLVDSPLSFIIQATQLLQHRPRKDDDVASYSHRLHGKDSHSFSFHVRGQKSILELNVSAAWGNMVDSLVDIKVKFHAIQVDDTTMSSGFGIHRVRIRSCLETIALVPSINLRTALTFLKPNDNKIRPLGPRELLPEGKQLHENVLTYNFTLPGTAEVSLNSPLFKDLLYESELFNQMIFLFDHNKSLLGTFDSFSKVGCKLEKGSYTAKVHLWHFSQDYLQKLSNLTLSLEQKLSEAISLPIYYSKRDALIGGKKAEKATFTAQREASLFVTSFPDEKWPKNLLINPGSVLRGNILIKDSNKTSLLSQPFNYLIDALPSSDGKKATSEKKGPKNLDEEYRNALLELELSWLSKLEGEEREKLTSKIDTMRAEGDLLPTVNLAKIDALESSKTVNKEEKNAKIILLTNEIIESVNLTQLIASLVESNIDVQLGSLDPEVSKKTEKLSKQLTRAYCKKGIALAQSLTSGEEADSSVNSAKKQEVLSELEQIWLNLNKLHKGDLMKEIKQTGKFLEEFYRARGEYSSVLKVLLKMQSEESTQEVQQRIIDLLSQKNELSYIKKFLQRNLNAKFCKDYHKM